MPRHDQPIPDLPPSGTALPDHERRDRAATLEWMHQAAEPRRKKRVDPLPDDMAGWNRRAFGDAFEDDPL